ncbi:MAG: prephenate dehydrogenase, partial [Bacillota bacterium]|nr:prephenate dehydrogenase [Bacillota bacterium]
MIDKVAIIGLGLIGGSLAMALTQRSFANEIVGIDINQEIIDKALELKAIDRGTTSLIDGVKNASLVVLCVPVSKIFELAEKIKPYLKEGCIVTDVGSTKADIVTRLEDIFFPQCSFVGGHPMAGSEQHGIEAADKYLLENAYYIVTPTDKTSAAALAVVGRMIEAAGGKEVTIGPKEHDQIVAFISHLPHIVAVSLVNSLTGLSDITRDPLALAAGGFRDSTRIANSDPLLWRDICFSNREQVLSSLASFKKALTELEDSIRANDQERFVTSFAQAKQKREKIPAKAKGLLPGIYQVIVTVPDRPGMIG